MPSAEYPTLPGSKHMRLGWRGEFLSGAHFLEPLVAVQPRAALTFMTVQNRRGESGWDLQTEPSFLFGINLCVTSTRSLPGF